MEVAGANRRWHLPFRCRGSRRESAVAQLFSLACYAKATNNRFAHCWRWSLFDGPDDAGWE